MVSHRQCNNAAKTVVLRVMIKEEQSKCQVKPIKKIEHIEV